jgi:hypothetical protein
VRRDACAVVRVHTSTHAHLLHATAPRWPAAQAAGAKFPYALINLGTMYRDGVHYPQDLERALECFETARGNSAHAARLADELKEYLSTGQRPP